MLKVLGMVIGGVIVFGTLLVMGAFMLGRFLSGLPYVLFGTVFLGLLLGGAVMIIEAERQRMADEARVATLPSYARLTAP